MRDAPATTDLDGVRAFAALPRRERARVRRHADIVEVDPGTALVSADERLRHVYFVLEGQAVAEAGGRLLAVIDVDGIIGLQSAFDRSGAPATVTAVTPMRLAALGRAEFHGLLDEVPGLARRILGLQVARPDVQIL